MFQKKLFHYITFYQPPEGKKVIFIICSFFPHHLPPNAAIKGAPRATQQNASGQAISAWSVQDSGPSVPLSIPNKYKFPPLLASTLHSLLLPLFIQWEQETNNQIVHTQCGREKKSGRKKNNSCAPKLCGCRVDIRHPYENIGDCWVGNSRKL